MLLIGPYPRLQPTGRLRRPVARLLVVRDGANPTFDYYLAPRCRAVSTRVCDLADGPPADADWTGAFVLFCRYLSSAWLGTVERHRGEIAGVGMMLDDDIDAMAADPAIPLWYRLRLVRRHLRFRRRLAANLDLLWVSNARIAAPHDAPHTILPPIAGVEDEPRSRPAGAAFRVAFHSTSVHEAEHRWLRPVIEQAVAAVPDLRVDVTAGWPLRRLWRGVPRTTIVASQPWPAFRAWTAETGADLLLAPLLPSRANAARAWTKRIDAARLGAALVVSDASVYHPGAEESRLGLCLPCDPARWAAAIAELARDLARVQRLRDLNRSFVQQAAMEVGETGL